MKPFSWKQLNPQTTSYNLVSAKEDADEFMSLHTKTGLKLCLNITVAFWEASSHHDHCESLFESHTWCWIVYSAYILAKANNTEQEQISNAEQGSLYIRVQNKQQDATEDDTESCWDIQKDLCNIPTFPCQAQGCVGDGANKLSKREARLICCPCAWQHLVPVWCLMWWSMGTGTTPLVCWERQRPSTACDTYVSTAASALTGQIAPVYWGGINFTQR